jgi:hypothetical protein
VEPAGEREGGVRISKVERMASGQHLGAGVARRAVQGVGRVGKGGEDGVLARAASKDQEIHGRLR